jgi:hypothetical protein
MRATASNVVQQVPHPARCSMISGVRAIHAVPLLVRGSGGLIPPAPTDGIIGVGIRAEPRTVVTCARSQATIESTLLTERAA